VWPPTLADLKLDMGPEYENTTADDERLQLVLDAAVAFVERVRAGEFNFTADPDSQLPAPSDDLILGTLRLAGRWHTRRRSPDGLLQLGELGSGRVPTVDQDVAQMLGIGRFRGMAFA
jgi:hypothetical protein